MIKNKKLRILIYFFVALYVLGKLNVTADKSMSELALIYAQAPSKFTEIEGINIHYRDEGEGDVIVLVHGTGSSLHTWDDWTKDLIKTHRVIRLDLPAYGLTGADPKKRYSSMDYVNLLDTFLIQLGVNDFYLGGNSLGGLISWLYTSYHDEKVKKLILLDPSGFPFRSTPFVIQFAKTPVLNQLLRYFTPKSYIEKNLKEVYYDDSLIRQETIDRYHNLTLFEGNRQAFIDRAYIEREDYTDRLEIIQTETLVLWGENDAWIPVDDAAKFQSALSNSTVKIMPKTGHVPMEERPEESLSIVMDFILN